MHLDRRRQTLGRAGVLTNAARAVSRRDHTAKRIAELEQRLRLKRTIRHVNHRALIARMEARRELSNDPDGIIAEPVDRAQYAWYDPTCPCGLPPGDCKEHPRAGPPSDRRKATGRGGS